MEPLGSRSIKPSLILCVSSIAYAGIVNSFVHVGEVCLDDASLRKGCTAVWKRWKVGRCKESMVAFWGLLQGVRPNERGKAETQVCCRYKPCENGDDALSPSQPGAQ